MVEKYTATRECIEIAYTGSRHTGKIITVILLQNMFDDKEDGINKND